MRPIVAALLLAVFWPQMLCAQPPGVEPLPVIQRSNSANVAWLPRAIATPRVARAPFPPRAEKSSAAPVAADLGLDRLPPPHPTGPMGSLTLADVQEIALANNPTLVQAAMQVRAAKFKCEQAGLYPNPVVGYSAEEMGDEGTSGKQGMFVSQEVVTGQKLKLQRQVVAWEVQQAQCDWQAQQRRVLNDVRTQYYNALLAQRTVELQRKLVEIGDAAVNTTSELLKGKEVSRVDLLQSRIEVNTARLTLTKAQHEHEAAWRSLMALAGQPHRVVAPLAGDVEERFPELQWETAWQNLVTNSPELRRARAGVQRARWTYQRERAERIPNVELEASMHYDNVTRDTITGVQVGVPLMIFNRNQGNIGKAQSEIIAAAREVQRVELALQQRLAEAFERYATAREHVGRYKDEILPDAQKSLDLVIFGYRQGELDYLTMLTAQRTYFRANLAYLETLHSLWESGVTIEGMLLTGGLEPVENR